MLGPIMFYIHLVETERPAFWFYKRQNSRSSINTMMSCSVTVWLWCRRALPHWALGTAPGQRCQATRTSSISEKDQWKRKGHLAESERTLDECTAVCTCLLSRGCWMVLKSSLTPSYFASSPIHFPTRSEKHHTSIRDVHLKCLSTW